MKKLNLLFIAVIIFACNPQAFAQDADTLKPETFVIESGDSTMVMQKYFIVFLKRGPNTDQTGEELAELQRQHLAHINWLADNDYISLAGPFGDDGDIRGILVFHVATIEKAIELSNLDPAVKAGRLKIEAHPWWAGKGTKLK